MCTTDNENVGLSPMILLPMILLVEWAALPNEIDGPDEIGLEVDDGAGDLLNLFPSYGVPGSPSPDDKEGDPPPFSLRDR